MIRKKSQPKKRSKNDSLVRFLQVDQKDRKKILELDQKLFKFYPEQLKEHVDPPGINNPLSVVSASQTILSVADECNLAKKWTGCSQ